MRRPEEAARADVSRWRDDPTALPQLTLGRFEEAPLRAVAVRGLLTLRVPPRLLTPLARRPSGRRLVSAYCYWRTVRGLVPRDDWRRLTNGTTILLYHAVGGGGEPASRFIVPHRRLERQLRWLRQHRPLISLDELVECRLESRLPPAGAVVITFDDGYADNAQVLRELGVPATIFLVTESVGAENRWDSSGLLSGRKLLSWDEMADLSGSGVEAGAHTRTHPVLSELAGEQLEAEIAGSREDLRRFLGRSVRTFAYPFGAWNEETAATAARAGFACACTVRQGRNDAGTPAHALRRVEIHGSDSWFRFRLAIILGHRDLVDRLLRRARRKQ